MNISNIPVLTELQNESDIRGIAIETETKVMNLTNDRIERIAYGFAAWLKDIKKLAVDDAHYPIRVAVGHDSRLSANRIKEVLIEGLTNANFEVIDVGLATTPSMFMATQFPAYDCDAAIMITASHLPSEYNGLKFFTKDGGAEKEDIQYMLEHADWGYVYWGNMKGFVTKRHLLKDYSQDLVRKIREGIQDETNYEQPLKGAHIVVDAGNGAGGFFATEVLEPLGADISGSQFLDPDGHFPNHIPNPDNKAAMESLKQAVLENQADLGIIFDTDVDRSAIMDKEGESINRNALIGMIAAIVLDEYPGSTIVTDSTTSNHLETFINDLGGKQHRFKRGYRNVINEAIALNEKGISSEIAIEVSGHAALKENYFLDDGAYLVAKLLIQYAHLLKKGQSLTDLIASLKEPVESEEIRIQINASDFKLYGQNALEDFRAFVKNTADFALEPVNHEGVRVNLSDEIGGGFILLRMSLHEPVMPMNIEVDTAGGFTQVMNLLQPFFAAHEKLVIPEA
ncbi:phosphohexomutase domain-containing protein [Isobaculum melis]|uniref:Phosphomannomutase n=1 Tax=Isobaculum melis TaxID=142588 RepID=A0A1H9QK51_9LACT|nr:phosphomannomutase/phosphoglucomutase [Isobaculum melis]SER60886.1 Phosphomannomutase [Isobaculum melis]